MHNIRVLREKIGFSQQQVAESVNVSQQAVARWENGLAKPRADLLPELAVLFHCTIDELFKEPDNKTPPAGPGVFCHSNICLVPFPPPVVKYGR